ncbi:DNA-binding transcriptional repressor AcrR, partial [Raoultella ornithinolytica]
QSLHVLEATVTEERRRLMMEIIFHKCEFVGEMAVVQKAQRSLCLESYERIEHTLKECIAANMLPANLLTRRAAVLMRSYLSGLMENWLFAPDSFDLEKEARDYVAILLEMYQFCPTLRAPSEAKN